MFINTLRQTALAVVACSALAACGGGSGSATHTGVFVDSAVSGLSYTASPSGLSGTTDAAGHFDYKDGDTITFKLGNVTLGTAPALAQVTPKSIADATTSNSADAANIASNIARFLQTFDADGNPDNGISIDPETINAAAPVNFNQAPADFTSDAGYTALIQSTGATPITNDQASAHAERSFLQQLAGTWVVKGSSNTLLTVTFFTDGTYLKGGQEDDADCGGIDGKGNGVELGDFDYDAANATITVTKVRVNTDGSCGLENGTVFTNVVINGNTLTLTAPDGAITLTKPDNNGIIGSWLADQPFAGQQLTHPVVVTFFANGNYVIADSGINEVDTDPADGAAKGSERGTWSVNGSGVLTTTQAIDTNGSGVGFSDLAAGTTLTVGTDGKLVLHEPGFPPDLSFTRLPLASKINAGDLAGAWYISGPDGTPDATTESAASNYVVFNKDGTYLLGSQEDDQNCHDDYANNASTSGNAASYADGSNGSESAHWRLDTGTGILSVHGLIFETNGSCGLYNVYSKFPENHLILDKVNADTINVTTYEYQDGGTGEDNSHTFIENHFVLKRIPSTAAALTGAWVKDGSQDTILFFGDGSFFTIGGSSAGGVIRGTYDLSSNTLTRTVDGTSENCVDTISATSMCLASPTEPVVAELTFGNNNSSFTIGSDTYRKL